MMKIKFTKMVASGNDFAVIQKNRLSTIHYPLSTIAQKICDRKNGTGADGLLVLEKSKKADIRMRIFNADGSEAEMCGNGARCIVKYIGQRNIQIETKAGIIQGQAKGDNIKIKLTDPKNLKLNIPIQINNRTLRINFINTGVPHAVIFVAGLEKMDVFNLGRQIRYHKEFAPAGTNVDFVEVLNNNSISVRTYERGVEDETLACGTGAVASAIITHCRLAIADHGSINVHTKSGEVLKVYFKKEKNKFKDLWLEGRVRVVYKGEYYV